MICASVALLMRVDDRTLGRCLARVDPEEDDEVPGVEARELCGVEHPDLLQPEVQGLLRLGRFLTAQTDESGAVIAQFDTNTMEPDADSRSKYYTGEAYWALARLHRTFPDAGFGAASDRDTTAPILPIRFEPSTG